MEHIFLVSRQKLSNIAALVLWRGIILYFWNKIAPQAGIGRGTSWLDLFRLVSPIAPNCSPKIDHAEAGDLSKLYD